MVFIKYTQLSLPERHSAQNLADRLLQEVEETRPPKFINRNYANGFPFMRAEKVLGAILNREQTGTWGASIAFSEANKIIQVGRDSRSTYEDTLAILARIIATTKQMARPVPHDALETYSSTRRINFPVRYRGNDLTTITLRNDRIPKLARYFASRCPDLCAYHLVDKLELAKHVVRSLEDHGPDPDVPCAAAFLSANGIPFVDCCDPRPEFFWCKVDFAR